MIDVRALITLILSGTLAACASSPSFIPGGPPQSNLPTSSSTPPPMRPAEPTQPVPAQSFRAPQIMRVPGLENVIGESAAQLQRRFGNPRLHVEEGDALKLQFRGEPCVLDIYLYPLSPGARPSATHVEARRASDGRPVDRASCVDALKRS